MQFERNVGLLVNRLRTEDAYRRHPEIADERIERPLVIVGLARTGTTMLHRMMASDPRWLALLWYESRNPAPFPDSEHAATDPRITDAEAEVKAMLEGSPDLIAAHPMDAHAPDEEIMLVEHAFTSWNPEAFCRVPGYSAYLDTIDLLPGYRYLARLLRFSSGRNTARRDCDALGAQGALPPGLARRAVRGDAGRADRDDAPRSGADGALASRASCARCTCSAAIGGSLEIGAHWGGRGRARSSARSPRARCARTASSTSLRRARRRPDGQVRRIYAHAGSSSRRGGGADAPWAVENERDRRPCTPYTLEEFGYTQEGLRRDFAAILRAIPRGPARVASTRCASWRSAEACRRSRATCRCFSTWRLAHPPEWRSSSSMVSAHYPTSTSTSKPPAPCPR
jgi:hypothetical protein